MSEEEKDLRARKIVSLSCKSECRIHETTEILVCMEFTNVHCGVSVKRESKTRGGRGVEDSALDSWVG